ncbi:MAG: hypothetical protein ACFE0S_17665 [Rhodospirillales bacterium]
MDDRAWRALVAARRRRWLGRIEPEAAKPCAVPRAKPGRRPH